MEELVDSHRRERHVGEGGHHIAHLVGVEGHTHGILHPGVGHEDPVGREADADGGEPCGGEVESLADTLPAEEHHRDEGALEEEGRNTFDGEGRSEDVADKPRVVAPVGAELKFEDDAGGHAAGEVDAEKEHPELGNAFPALIAGLVIDTFHNADNQR